MYVKLLQLSDDHKCRILLNKARKVFEEHPESIEDDMLFEISDYILNLDIKDSLSFDKYEIHMCILEFIKRNISTEHLQLLINRLLEINKYRNRNNYYNKNFRSYIDQCFSSDNIDALDILLKSDDSFRKLISDNWYKAYSPNMLNLIVSLFENHEIFYGLSKDEMKYVIDNKLIHILDFIDSNRYITYSGLLKGLKYAITTNNDFMTNYLKHTIPKEYQIYDDDV